MCSSVDGSLNIQANILVAPVLYNMPDYINRKQFTNHFGLCPSIDPALPSFAREQTFWTVGFACDEIFKTNKILLYSI